MAGTRAGGKAAAATNRAKHDAEYMKKFGMGFYAYIGSQGGKKGTTGGFYVNRELASEVGRIGGLKSRRRRRH